MLSKLIALTLTLLASLVAFASEGPTVPMSRDVLAPQIYMNFCFTNQAQCAPVEGSGAYLQKTDRQRMLELYRVNSDVNTGIEPYDDHLMGHVIQVWPKAGNCNDYATTKQAELLKRGWPSGSVRLAEVIIPNVSNHLILVATVGGKDVVLDSLSPAIVDWFETGYQWRRLQGTELPQHWRKAAGLLSTPN